MLLKRKENIFVYISHQMQEFRALQAMSKINSLLLIPNLVLKYYYSQLFFPREKLEREHEHVLTRVPR